MYYVIQVTPGKEAEIEKYITERIPDNLYSVCFHPVRHVKKKFRGEWKDKHEKLLPGYVFINSNKIQELYLQFRQIPMMTKLLGRDMEFVAALTNDEAMWLEKIVPASMGKEIEVEVPISRVEIDENDEIKILSGPLRDMTGMVKRINLHKRIAEVEIQLMGRKMVIYFGIEMIQKK